MPSGWRDSLVRSCYFLNVQDPSCRGSVEIICSGWYLCRRRAAEDGTFVDGEGKGFWSCLLVSQGSVGDSSSMN